MEKLKETTKSKPGISSSVTATDKCRAVLSVWTEKSKPTQVCKEMGVKWTILMHWQNRAMEGMLQALEPRRNLEKGSALSPRLQEMMEKREKNLLAKSAKKLGDRLEMRLASIAAKKDPKSGENVKPQQKE